jgi:LPXTG-site transpeptidase (sortase) family protein
VKHTDVIRFIILRTIGNFLVMFAIFGIFATFGPALYYEVSLQIAHARGIRYVVAAAELVKLPVLPSITPPPNQAVPISTPTPTPKPIFSNGVDSFAAVLTGPTEQILRPADTNFSLVIPAIGASAKVFPNIDAARPDIFLPVLLKGIAHAKGTALPGQKGNIYLFAHSTDNFWDVGRYNAVFYLLKELKKGDEIAIFYKGVRHNYFVTNTKIVSPSDISYIVNAKKQSKEQLILQTCWPPGTIFQRLIIFAEPKH